MTKARIASALYRMPFRNIQKNVEAWVAIDLKGISVIPEREYVFRVPRNTSLPVAKRIIGSGITPE